MFFGSLGGHFAEQAAKGCFDRGICCLGNPPVEQVVALHPDEMMGLGHELKSFGEIFFEKLTKQLPFTVVEKVACLER